MIQAVLALALGATLAAGPNRGGAPAPGQEPRASDWTTRPDEVLSLLRQRSPESRPSSVELEEIAVAFDALGAHDDFASWVVHEASRELAGRLRGDPDREGERTRWLRLAVEHAAARGEGGRSVRARVALELGDLLRRSGNDDEARSVLEAALAGLGARDGIRPFVLWALADIAQYRLEWDAAEAQLAQAEACLQEIPQHEAIRYSIYGLRGQVFVGMGLLDQAAAWVERAVEGADELRARGTTDWGLLLAAHTHRANLRMATGRHQRLIAEVEPFLAGAQVPASNAAGRAALLLRLGRAHQELSHTRPEHARRARALLSDALDDPSLRAADRQTADLRLAHLALRAGDAEGARGHLESASTRAAELGAASSPLDRAFLAALELRLALLSDRGSADVRDRLAQVERRFRDVLARWETSAERLGGIGFLSHERTRLVLSELMHAHTRLDGSDVGGRAALRALFDAQRVGTLSRRLGAEHEVFEEVPARLVPAGGGLLVYFPGKERSHLFAWDSTGIVHAEGVGRGQFEELQTEVARLTSRPPASEQARAAECLQYLELSARLTAQILPAPIRARLNAWRCVTVVGADLLELPMEGLVLGGRALGLELSITSVPSMPLALFLDRRPLRGVEAKDLVFVSHLVSPEGTAPAPIEPSPLRRLEALYPGARVVSVFGPEATVERVTALLQEPTRLLQLFAHGERDPGEELPRGMRLAPSAALPDGFLGAARIAATPVAADVVIAAACGVGSGPARLGDPGAGHLGGAFLEAGARAVVLPSTDVALAPTRRLLEEMHRGLARGASVAEALRRARESLAQDRAFDHPFYYATVRVLGMGHAAPFAERRGHSRATPWALCAAVTVLLFFARRRRKRT